jgi:hypothetical protein
MTTPENVNTWRGLADELNPEQIARLEEWERPRPVMPRGDTPGDLLAWARGYARQNLADALGLTAARRNSMVRALCCQCGDLRIVSGSHIRRDGNRTVDDGCDARGWRMTGTVKCSVCKGRTTHALLRDDTPDCRDCAEPRGDGNRSG